MSDVATLDVDAPQRLDHFLCRCLPHLSRRHLQSLIGAGEVRVNGRRATKKGIQLRGGDTVTLARKWVAVRSAEPQPELALPVLYEDADLAAIDKPAGLASVAQRVTDRETVANFVAARYPETAALAGGATESGIVHRLDTATSGVLLVARTAAAHTELRRQFAAHLVEKEYLAVVGGHIESAGTIAHPLVGKAGDPSRMVVAEADTAGARAAETRIRPLRSDGQSTLLAVRIATGARHQIRAHLAAIGHPIVGDAGYGGAPAARLLLHACEVRFSHPATRESMTIRSPTPAELDLQSN